MSVTEHGARAVWAAPLGAVCFLRSGVLTCGLPGQICDCDRVPGSGGVRSSLHLALEPVPWLLSVSEMCFRFPRTLSRVEVTSRGNACSCLDSGKRLSCAVGKGRGGWRRGAWGGGGGLEERNKGYQSKGWG